MVEILVRVGLALVLSLSLALLLAWGWDRSDRIPVSVTTDTSLPAISFAQATERP